MFRVGQKVARIKLPQMTLSDMLFVAKYGIRYPQEDEVCEVAALLDENRIQLVEYQFHGAPGLGPGYLASAFRPVTENKSSISFTTGADPDSERWDNRVKTPARKKERAQ